MKKGKIKFSKEELKGAKKQYKELKKKMPSDELFGFDAGLFISIGLLLIVNTLYMDYTSFKGIFINITVYLFIIGVYYMIFVPMGMYYREFYFLSLDDKNLDCTENTITYKDKDITKEIKRYKNSYKQIAYINRLKNRI